MFGRNKDKAKAENQPSGLDEILPPITEGAKTFEEISLIGSSVHPSTFELEDGTIVQLGHVVREAFKLAQPATPEQWNEMPQEEREIWIQEVVDAMPLKVETVKTGIKPAGAPLNIEYNASLEATHIGTLTAHLDALGCAVKVERCKDKAGVDHYNVTVSREAGDTSLQTAARIDENATEKECKDVFFSAVKELGLA